MLLMNYPSIRGEDSIDYSKKATWNLLHAYIDANSQRLIDEYPGNEIKSMSILKSKCLNITFSDQIRYNRLFQKVIHKLGESGFIYTKKF